jgi:lysophospholipase L1-like esterase
MLGRFVALVVAAILWSASALAADLILGVGDSIQEGLGSRDGVHSLGRYAAEMLTARGRDVAYINDGYSGRGSGTFLPIGTRDVQALHPWVVTIQCGSANGDWRSADTVRRAFDAAIVLAELVKHNGGIPILVTATPSYYGQGGDNPEWEANRQLSNSLVRAQASKYKILDIDALWGAGANPNSFKPEFDSGDKKHPSDAGSRAAAAALIGEVAADLPAPSSR